MLARCGMDVRPQKTCLTLSANSVLRSNPASLRITDVFLTQRPAHVIAELTKDGIVPCLPLAFLDGPRTDVLEREDHIACRELVVIRKRLHLFVIARHIRFLSH